MSAEKCCADTNKQEKVGTRVSTIFRIKVLMK